MYLYVNNTYKLHLPYQRLWSGTLFCRNTASAVTSVPATATHVLGFPIAPPPRALPHRPSHWRYSPWWWWWWWCANPNTSPALMTVRLFRWAYRGRCQHRVRLLPSDDRQPPAAAATHLCGATMAMCEKKRLCAFAPFEIPPALPTTSLSLLSLCSCVSCLLPTTPIRICSSLSVSLRSAAVSVFSNSEKQLGVPKKSPQERVRDKF